LDEAIKFPGKASAESNKQPTFLAAGRNKCLDQKEGQREEEHKCCPQ
jgi:hypothetical protein